MISPSNSNTITEHTLYVPIFCARWEGWVESGDEWGAHPQGDEMQTLHQMGSVPALGFCPVFYAMFTASSWGNCSPSGFFPPDYVKPWKLLQQTQAHCSLLCCVYHSQTYFPASCQKKEGGDAFGVPTPQMRVLGRVPGLQLWSWPG